MSATKKSKYNITKLKWTSSPEKRAAARAKAEQLRARLKEVNAELEGLKGWAKRLKESARFCVDVAAGEPSLTQLREAVEAAERYDAIQEETLQLRKDINEANSAAMYYQWHAGQTLGAGIGALFNHLVAEADSRKELEEKIENLKT